MAKQKLTTFEEWEAEHMKDLAFRMAVLAAQPKFQRMRRRILRNLERLRRWEARHYCRPGECRRGFWRRIRWRLGI